jgi:arylsulfatase A-like enzyme
MVQEMDEAVGRVLKQLDDLGLADNTLLVFTSDNGGLSTAGGSPTSNLPLKGGKGWNYEGGIRVPLIVRMPGRVGAGTTCDVPVAGFDLYPTLLAMVGLPSPSVQKVNGLSLQPLLERTGTLPGRALYWHFPHYSDQGGRPNGAVRLGAEKLIEFFEDEHLELYNLQDDPGEEHDLVASQPARAQELKAKLSAWRSSVSAQMPTSNPRPQDPYPRDGGAVDAL